MSASLSGGTTLAYDPLGRLWQTTSVSHGTTQFLYDGDKLASEYDGAGAIRRRFAWGPSVDEPILQDEGGALNCSGTRFLHTDHQGSIIATANCSGNRSGLSGPEAQNRAMLVNDLARRSFDAILRNPAEAASRIGDLVANNKAFIVGRFGTASAVVQGLGGRVGGGLGSAALAGGAVRAINAFVGQLEKGGFDTSNLSNQTLGAVATAGMAGASIRFDAKSGDVTATIRSQTTASNITTRTHHICNVKSEKGC